MADMGGVRGVQVWRGHRLGREASATFIPVRTVLSSDASVSSAQCSGEGRSCRGAVSCSILLKLKQPCQGCKCSETPRPLTLQDPVAVTRS